MSKRNLATLVAGAIAALGVSLKDVSYNTAYAGEEPGEIPAALEPASEPEAAAVLAPEPEADPTATYVFSWEGGGLTEALANADDTRVNDAITKYVEVNGGAVVALSAGWREGEGIENRYSSGRLSHDIFATLGEGLTTLRCVYDVEFDSNRVVLDLIKNLDGAIDVQNNETRLAYHNTIIRGKGLKDANGRAYRAQELTPIPNENAWRIIDVCFGGTFDNDPMATLKAAYDTPEADAKGWAVKFTLQAAKKGARPQVDPLADVVLPPYIGKVLADFRPDPSPAYNRTM